MLDCPRAGNDRKEAAEKNIRGSPLVRRGDKVGRRGRAGALDLEGFVALGDDCEEEEAWRHC